MLVAVGHEVTGTTRSAERTQAPRAAGAEPLVADAWTPRRSGQAIEAAQADVVFNQLTAIPKRINPSGAQVDADVRQHLDE
jgi:uncharacterized protein YbjT (DUF2867 family)